MQMRPFSSVVTNLFLVVEKDAKGRETWKPGIELLASLLTRTAAYKIYVPKVQSAKFPRIEEVIKRCPPSLADRISIVDKDETLFNRARKFLAPVYEESEDNSLVLLCDHVLDFLYKVHIASKLHAEADISSAPFVGNMISLLRENMKSEEAKFRLDQLCGIYCIYQKPEKMDTIAILPQPSEPFIYQRINDLLDSAEIIELSKTRYYLGIPSKAKAAVIRIRKHVRRILEDKRYSGQIGAATDLVQTAGSLGGFSVPTRQMYEILKNIQMVSYSPPIIDLDFFRAKIAREFIKPNERENSSSCFALPFGTHSVTVANYGSGRIYLSPREAYCTELVESEAHERKLSVCRVLVLHAEDSKRSRKPDKKLRAS